MLQSATTFSVEDRLVPIVNIDLPELPHGHGLSFKRGVVDGLIETLQHEDELPPTHRHSYNLGTNFGQELRAMIAGFVRK